jgi:hypothetical protein
MRTFYRIIAAVGLLAATATPIAAQPLVPDSFFTVKFRLVMCLPVFRI